MKTNTLLLIILTMFLVACGQPAMLNGRNPFLDNLKVVKGPNGKDALIIPECPDLTEPKSTYYHIASNFGCATAHNLGYMLANPSDMRQERIKDIKHWADRHSLGMLIYRNGVKTSLSNDGAGSTSKSKSHSSLAGGGGSGSGGGR